MIRKRIAQYVNLNVSLVCKPLSSVFYAKVKDNLKLYLKFVGDRIYPACGCPDGYYDDEIN